MTAFIAAFTTGLIAGGLTCLAVQGGLLATALAEIDSAGRGWRAKVFPTLAFLVAKLIAYTGVGFLLGWLGSVVSVSLTLRAVLLVCAGVFMLGSALHLLHVHPFFRVFALSVPESFRRFVKNRAYSAHVFGPAMLGAATVLVPCGTTQAMMALAMASASGGEGALTMFAFTLGTVPLFLGFGVLMTSLGAHHRAWFRRGVALLLIFVSAYTLYGAAVLLGIRPRTERVESEQVLTPVSEITFEVHNSGYTYDRSYALKADEIITLHLVNKGAYGCVQVFTIPKLGIQKVVPSGMTKTVQFQAPAEPGELSFSCSMGMYSGSIQVVK